MIEIFTDKLSLSYAAADMFRTLANTAVSNHGRFLVGLSGGSTPGLMFKLLAQSPYLESIPWQNVIVFWSDERLVSPDSYNSNYRQAEDLLLRHVPIPLTQIIRVKGELDSDMVVAEYIHQLKTFAPAGEEWPRFDLVLLGMGSDGHTASLFPGEISAEETTEPVIAVTANYESRPAHRVTLTPMVINQAHHILFLATGSSKAAALTAVLQDPYQPEKWPAQRIHPEDGRIYWFVDEAAAANIKT